MPKRPPLRASARLGNLVLGRVQFNPGPLNRFLRDELGRFTSQNFQHALFEAHNEMALKVQGIALEEFDRAQKKVNRPQNRGAFRLAVGQPGNFRVTANGFDFGLPEHYDKTVALYWRFIEEGGINPLLKGRPFTGVFWNPGVAGPDHDSFRAHGRFDRRPATDGEGMHLDKRYFEGYGFHDATNDRFFGSDIGLAAYRAAFLRHGFNYVRLFRANVGRSPGRTGA